MLALLYMRRFLLAWQQWWEQRLQARVQVYADDLVILCRGTAVEALAAARDLMRRVKLELNEEKTCSLQPSQASRGRTGRGKSLTAA